LLRRAAVGRRPAKLFCAGAQLAGHGATQCRDKRMLKTDSLPEEFSIDGKTVTHVVQLDPAIPQPGESQSQHALQCVKMLVDSHCAEGDLQGAVKGAVGFFSNMEPVDQAEAERYIKARTGATKETIREQARDFNRRFPEPQPPKASPVLWPTPEHLTDLGNAKRLVQEHRASIRYLAAKGVWLVWDGKRWAEDETGEVYRLAKETVRTIYREASRIKDDKRREALVSHASRSESERAIKAMVSLAATEPGIPVLMKDLDTDPYLFNCANGTLELRTGDLRPHRPDDLITKITPVALDPEARSEVWERFLWTIVGGDSASEATKGDVFALMDFMAKVGGSALVGENPDEHFFFIYGPPASGKSTRLEAIAAAMGDYARTADFESFLHQRQPRETRSSIVALVGSRFVRSSETDRGKRLAEGILNTMSGGDRMRVRDLHSKSFEFRPTWKLFLAANNRPKLTGDEREGIWRRILQLPFNMQIPPERRDPSIKRQLTDPAISGPAILAWLVKGCLAWQREGLHPPKQVLDATLEYREEMDCLHEFCTTCCEATENAGDTVRAAALREAYRSFTGSGFSVSRTQFGIRMGAKYEKGKDREGVFYKGIRLRLESEWEA